MPTREEQQADPSTKAYAEALANWMAENPGVTIKEASLDVWDQEQLVTALAGGTAPSMFPGDVIGGWGPAAVKAGMAKGLVADVTDYLDRYELDKKLNDYAKPVWANWAVDGRYFAAPWLYSCGTGIHYRLDLVQELGLSEPKPGWTWDDVRALAKGMTDGNRKGIALQDWGMAGRLEADGMGLLTRVPAPDTNWNWQWDYLTRSADWVQLIEGVRAMVFKDGSVLADVSLTVEDAFNAFLRGSAAMYVGTVVSFATTPDDEQTNVDLEKRLDRPLEEIICWQQQPIGLNGHTGTMRAQVDLLSFSPDMSDDALDKAINLHMYMKGPGLIRQKKAAFEETQDPRRVYNWDNITPLFVGVLEDLPSSPEEAWGEKFMEAVYEAAEIPPVPHESSYFPAEKSDGPVDTAYSDATGKWFYERAERDIVADLRRVQDIRNKQAADFTSSTSDEDFVAAARKFYQDHAAYWETNAPDFFQNVFQGWYQETVVPALG